MQSYYSCRSSLLLRCTAQTIRYQNAFGANGMEKNEMGKSDRLSKQEFRETWELITDHTRRLMSIYKPHTIAITANAELLLEATRSAKHRAKKTA